MLLYRVSTAFDDVSSNGLTATSFLFLEIDMLAAIVFLVWILFNLWLTFLCIAVVFTPLKIGGRSLDLEELVVFVIAAAICGVSWYYSLNSVTVSVG